MGCQFKQKISKAAANARLVSAFNRPCNRVEPTDPTDPTDQTEVVTRHRSMIFNRCASVIDLTDQNELVSRQRSVTFTRPSSAVDQTDETELVDRRRLVAFGAKTANPSLGNCPLLTSTPELAPSDRAEPAARAISDHLNIIPGLVVQVPKSALDSPTDKGNDDDSAYANVLSVPPPKPTLASRFVSKLRLLTGSMAINDRSCSDKGNDDDSAYANVLSVPPPKPNLASRFVSKLRLLTGSMAINDRSCSGAPEPESPQSPSTHTPSPPPTLSQSTEVGQLREFTSFTTGTSPMARRRSLSIQGPPNSALAVVVS
eukprot:gene27443-4746_t